jgi:hypothetical protein
MSDEFKIVFDSMQTARSDAQRTANQISQSAGEQVNRMQGVLGGAWGDDAAEAAFQSYQMRQKATGYHTDGMNAEGSAYGNVADIGQQALRQAINIVSNI